MRDHFNALAEQCGASDYDYAPTYDYDADPPDDDRNDPRAVPSPETFEAWTPAELNEWVRGELTAAEVTP
jgi:hypothetical protein